MVATSISKYHQTAVAFRMFNYDVLAADISLPFGSKYLFGASDKIRTYTAFRPPDSESGAATITPHSLYIGGTPINLFAVWWPGPIISSIKKEIH